MKNKKKNKVQIRDYKTLITVKAELKQHIAEQEDIVKQTVSVLGGFIGMFGKKSRGSSKKQEVAQINEENSFDNVMREVVRKTLQQIGNKIAKTSQSKKATIGLATVGSLIIAGLITRKVKSYINAGGTTEAEEE